VGDDPGTRLAAGMGIVGSEFERAAETGLQVLAHVHDFHARHDHKFAGEHVARLIVVGKLATDAAILAILIPAEAAVRDRLRAEKLEAAKQRVALRNFHGLAENFDFDEAFVRAERTRSNIFLDRDHANRQLCFHNGTRVGEWANADNGENALR